MAGEKEREKREHEVHKTGTELRCFSLTSQQCSTIDREGAANPKVPCVSAASSLDRDYGGVMMLLQMMPTGWKPRMSR